MYVENLSDLFNTQLLSFVFQIPQIVYSLQNSVQAVLLGGVVESNWANQGVPSKSLMETWSLSSDIPSVGGSGCVQPSIAGDGSHLYLQGSCGLLKIGSGYGNTERVRDRQSVSCEC